MPEQAADFNAKVEEAAHQIMPPQLRAFEEAMKAERKKLLTDTDFEKAEHLRQFIGQYLYPRMKTLLHLLLLGNHEAVSMGLNGQQQIDKIVGRLGEMKVDADNIWDAIDEIDNGGITAEDLDEVTQALFALRVALKSKVPESEKEIWAKFQNCLDVVKELQEQVEEDDEPDEAEPGDGPAALPETGATP